MAMLELEVRVVLVVREAVVLVAREQELQVQQELLI
jgi:hypothetical protein